MNKNNKTIDLSLKTIFYFYLIPLILLILWYFRGIILIFLLSFIIASLLDRPLDFFEKRLKNRLLSVIIVYFLIFLFLGIFSYFIYPFFKDLILNFSEIKIFNNSLFSIPSSVDNKGSQTNFSLIKFLKEYLSLRGNLSQELVNQSYYLLTKIFGGISFAFLTFLLAFFLNLKKNTIELAIRFLSPKQYEEYLLSLWLKVRQKISGWFISQVILSSIVALLVYFTFLILGLPYKELIAVLSGLLDFLPYLGPLLAGILAFFVALSENIFLGLTVAGVFILIQALEGIIAPFIRSKTMDIHPVILVLAIMVGGKLAGFLGIIIALPFSACFFEVLKDYQTGKLKNL
ncbi:MAG: AI-2E family transporter [Minisyncoccia bacterium]